MSNEKQLKDAKLTPGGRKFCSTGELHVGTPSPLVQNTQTCKLVHAPDISSNDSHIRRLRSLGSREIDVSDRNLTLGFFMLVMEGNLCKPKQLITIQKRKKLDHHCGKGTSLLTFSKKHRFSLSAGSWGAMVLFVVDTGNQTQGISYAGKES